jgi:outer membrane protein assembly factor BamA
MIIAEFRCMRKALPIALACLSCIALGQEKRSAMTDKNYGQQYAAYMLKSTYYERGYMAASVDIRQSGKGDVYVVSPGPVFHFKEIKVVRLPDNLVLQVMKDAPKTGEVYSMARLDDWLIQETNRLAAKGTTQKLALQGLQVNRKDASVTVTVSFH